MKRRGVALGPARRYEMGISHERGTTGDSQFKGEPCVGAMPLCSPKDTRGQTAEGAEFIRAFFSLTSGWRSADSVGHGIFWSVNCYRRCIPAMPFVDHIL